MISFIHHFTNNFRIVFFDLNTYSSDFVSKKYLTFTNIEHLKLNEDISVEET